MNQEELFIHDYRVQGISVDWRKARELYKKTIPDVKPCPKCGQLIKSRTREGRLFYTHCNRVWLDE